MVIHVLVFMLCLFCDYMIRKKKLSARWRKFVRPVMWRCKWVELQLRELQSQVSKYDRELAECNRKKQCELDRDPTEDLGIKLVPFVSQNQSVKLMKRKKRKRVEETIDVASYTSSHSLLSYYGVNSFNFTLSLVFGHLFSRNLSYLRTLLQRLKGMLLAQPV